jgi:signal transduction histidine kinase/CheY-like chemotaxis protein
MQIVGSSSRRATDTVKVLAIDDDPDFAAMLRFSLALAGDHPFEIDRALNEAEAMEKLSAFSYDVITVDILLPDVNGLDLLGRITSDENSPPVVVTTGHGGEKVASRSFELGAAGYVIKDRDLPLKLSRAIDKAFEEGTAKKAAEMLNRESALALSTINNLGAVFFVTDLQGRLVRWNRRLPQITGRPDQELADIRGGDLVLGWEKLSAGSTGVHRTRNSYFQSDLVTADGAMVPCEFVVGAHDDYKGDSTGLYVIAQERDRTDGRPALNGMREVRPVATDLTGDAIFKTNLDGVITCANDVGGWLVGDSPAVFSSVRLEEVIHPDDIAEMLDGLLLAQTTLKKVTGVESRFWTHECWMWMDWNLVPDLNSAGECGGFQLTGRDITERRRAEDFLDRIIRELDYYAHTISHDLRGPLSAIMLAADSLRLLVERTHGPEVVEEVAEMSQIISDNTKKVGSMVIDLLTLAESAQQPDDVESVEVSSLVKVVLAELALMIEEKGAEVVADEDLGTLTANGLQMYQLFSNLIRNAIEHNDSEAPAVRVQYEGSAAGYHKYVVSDNGPGIPETEQRMIFDPFHKGDGGGTGIGLSTVHRIIKAYGGYIRVYNKPGACFEFCVKDATPRKQTTLDEADAPPAPRCSAWSPEKRCH